MDRAFRRAERSADWEDRARALRRAGQGELARAWVSAAARSGVPRASAVLEAEFPLDRDALALLRIVEETPPEAWGVDAPRAAEILLGDGDPRLASPALAWLEARAAATGPGRGAGVLRLSDLRQSLVEVGHAARVGLLLQEASIGLDRTLLLPDELEEVAEGALEARLGVGGRLRLAALFARVPEPDDRLAALWERVGWGSPPEDSAQFARVEQGRAGGLGDSLPWRPAWVRPVHREDLTLALTRGALRPRGRSPVGVELPDVTWVALCDLDLFMTLNDRHGHYVGDQVLVRVTEILQDVFGDRVVRYGGDEWILLYEREDGPQRLQRALDAVRRDGRLSTLCGGGVAFSAGLVRRTGASSKDLQRADEALYTSKREGRGRITLAPSSEGSP